MLGSYAQRTECGMPRVAFGLSAVALAGILLCGVVAPAAAEQTATREYAAQSRQRIIIRPHYPGPNAKRYCRSWLVQKYRVSGPVIVPRMQCWWQ